MTKVYPEPFPYCQMQNQMHIIQNGNISEITKRLQKLFNKNLEDIFGDFKEQIHVYFDLPKVSALMKSYQHSLVPDKEEKDGTDSGDKEIIDAQSLEDAAPAAETTPEPEPKAEPKLEPEDYKV